MTPTCPRWARRELMEELHRWRARRAASTGSGRHRSFLQDPSGISRWGRPGWHREWGLSRFSSCAGGRNLHLPRSQGSCQAQSVDWRAFSPMRRMNSTQLAQVFRFGIVRTVREMSNASTGRNQKGQHVGRCCSRGEEPTPGPQDKCPPVSGPLLTLPRTSPLPTTKQ